MNNIDKQGNTERSVEELKEKFAPIGDRVYCLTPRCKTVIDAIDQAVQLGRELENRIDWDTIYNNQAKQIYRAEKQCDKLKQQVADLTKQVEAGSGLKPLGESEVLESMEDYKEAIDGYVLYGDEGDYTPSENERVLMMDFLIGYVEENVKTVCSKFGKPKVKIGRERLIKIITETKAWVCLHLEVHEYILESVKQYLADAILKELEGE